MTAATRVTAGELFAERLAKDKQIVAAELKSADGIRVVDLHTPFESEGVEVKPIRAHDDAGLAIIRHSTAHVMADAVQRLFPGTKVTIGPDIDSGFYYDFDKAEGTFTEDDLAKIEAEMQGIIDGAHPFRRDVIDRDGAQAMFGEMGETYKKEIIDAIPEGQEISLYRHGAPDSEWVDVCQGPHVPHTGLLKAFKLVSVAGAYWRGDESNPMLQRIYGTAFANPKDLKKHLNRIEEAKKRDHRKLGKELDLFMFHDYAPAMPFFLPRGAGVYARLVNYMRGLYEKYGYQEVLTPQIFDKRLFLTSGHLPNYRENMYMPVTADTIDAADKDSAADKTNAEATEAETMEKLAAKPMNCPSHCLIFKQKRRSYRELPWRIADFGRLHRYERGGVVHGLARVRSFCQDDAHIFCTPDQLPGEIGAFCDLLFEVYNAFKFEKVEIKLATRPQKRIGTDAQWDEAETKLEQALVASGLPFEVLPGEGAFYGPKLEFHIQDALGRSWQLGTIQVDYNLPSEDRFNLTYVGSDGEQHQAVMLHRAILGSLERFMALYIEHTAAKFPVWIAPEQATVVTVTDGQNDYADEAVAYLRSRGLRVNSHTGSDKLGAKIRTARLMRVPYIAVVGDKEVENRTVSPRSRDLNKNLDAMSLEAFADKLVAEAAVPTVASKHDAEESDGA